MSTSKRRPVVSRPATTKPSQPAKQSTKKDVSQQRRERSPVEKRLVWGGIGLLALVVVYEAGARLSHWTAVSSIREVINEAGEEPVEIDEIRPVIRRKPTVEPDKMGLLDVTAYTWTWRGVLRKYKIRLLVDEDNEITQFELR